MTLEELQEALEVTGPLVAALKSKVDELEVFIRRIYVYINDPNFAVTVDVDAFVAIQVPIYTALLVEIETAADALGTDN
jgi:hypothetical protein